MTDPYRYADAITPDDDNDLPNAASMLFIGSDLDGGNAHTSVTVTPVGTPAGEYVTFFNIQCGTLLPLAVKRVWATGTAAQNIIGLR